MDKQQRQKFSPEVRERAVRMVIEHRGEHASQWAAIVSIAATNIGVALNRSKRPRNGRRKLRPFDLSLRGLYKRRQISTTNRNPLSSSI